MNIKSFLQKTFTWIVFIGVLAILPFILAFGINTIDNTTRGTPKDQRLKKEAPFYLVIYRDSNYYNDFYCSNLSHTERCVTFVSVFDNKERTHCGHFTITYNKTIIPFDFDIDGTNEPINLEGNEVYGR